MKKSVAIIGGGPSAMMAAAMLDENKFDVTIYERNAAPGRKFLVAGDGGFNLTHSEELKQFISRYTPASFFEPILSGFTNNDFQEWLKSIGIETYTGTSKRIFPVKGIKPIDVLTSILTILKQKKVSIKTKHTWKGWDAEQLVFIDTTGGREQIVTVQADITVFALGGGSWKVTGSDGSWTKYFIEKGIEIQPFQASNCAFEVKWSEDFLKETEGKSLKNIVLKCGGKEKAGEVVITSFGMEGGAIYALSDPIREQLNTHDKAELFIDLKPAFSVKDIENKLRNRGNKSLSSYLKNELNISSSHFSLLKTFLSKEDFMNQTTLSEKIKKLPISITSAALVDEAISTVGGIPLKEIDSNFQLEKTNNSYAIGEMLDWDAPTGGYLLQACFSMGFCLAKKLNAKY